MNLKTATKLVVFLKQLKLDGMGPVSFLVSVTTLGSPKSFLVPL